MLCGFTARTRTSLCLHDVEIGFEYGDAGLGGQGAAGRGQGVAGEDGIGRGDSGAEHAMDQGGGHLAGADEAPVSHVVILGIHPWLNTLRSDRFTIRTWPMQLVASGFGIGGCLWLGSDRDADERPKYVECSWLPGKLG